MVVEAKFPTIRTTAVTHRKAGVSNDILCKKAVTTIAFRTTLTEGC